MWAIVVHPRVKKDLARMPEEDAKRLLAAMHSLKSFPETNLDVKLIKGLKYSKYRILRARVGEYRIVFVPIWSERKILVVAVGKRKSVYQRLKKMTK